MMASIINIVSRRKNRKLEAELGKVVELKGFENYFDN